MLFKEILNKRLYNILKAVQQATQISGAHVYIHVNKIQIIIKIVSISVTDGNSNLCATSYILFLSNLLFSIPILQCYAYIHT